MPAVMHPVALPREGVMLRPSSHSVECGLVIATTLSLYSKYGRKHEGGAAQTISSPADRRCG